MKSTTPLFHALLLVVALGGCSRGDGTSTAVVDTTLPAGADEKGVEIERMINSYARQITPCVPGRACQLRDAALTAMKLESNGWCLDYASDPTHWQKCQTPPPAARATPAVQSLIADAFAAAQTCSVSPMGTDASCIRVQQIQSQLGQAGWCHASGADSASPDGAWTTCQVAPQPVVDNMDMSADADAPHMQFSDTPPTTTPGQ